MAIDDKSAIRRMLVAIFLIEGVIKAIIYAGSSVMTEESLKLSAIAVPAIALGLFCGNALHHRVSQKTFVRAVSALLLGLAAQAFITVSQ